MNFQIKEVIMKILKIIKIKEEKENEGDMKKIE